MPLSGSVRDVSDVAEDFGLLEKVSLHPAVLSLLRTLSLHLILRIAVSSKIERDWEK